ncbi:MAG: hypothetical protein HW386_1554 [Gammaproteobacteria bacterium]|nr:hypothetical protein [Gammaproteobacteria bacterium]
MQLNKLILELIFVSACASGVTVMAQTDPANETPVVPGVTVISQDAPGAVSEQEEDASVDQDEQAPLAEPETTENSQAAMPAVVTGVTAIAQDYTARKTASIPRTTSVPVLDGVLDDAAWQNATVITDIHQILPVDHGVPSERSEFYVMYDSDNLYIGAKLYDSAPDQINARQLIQGQLMQYDDTFDIILDPFNNMRSGYYFQVNPNAVRMDGIFENANQLNPDWDGIWDAAARINADGWTAEVAIPFKTLNFDPNNPNWGFSVSRTIARKKETQAWSSYDRRMNPGTTGVLTGLNGLQQGMGLDIIPTMVTGRRYDYRRSDADAVIEPSLDIVYKFTPSLTGVLTFNTDFSATEVDDRQVNLNRFALFYPEKRDFFLQDADIFAFGGLNENGIPFFSRRIGLSSFGEPVALDAGAKVTGRIGRWNVGTLAVRQAGINNVDPSMLMVTRVTANVLEESNVGAIMTYGDPLSNFNNNVVGTDFNYRNNHFMGDRSLTGNLWYQQSDTPGITVDQQSWGGQIGVNASEGFGGGLTMQRFGDGFKPALGFVNRVGIRRSQLNLAYRLRPEHDWIRSIFSFVRLEHIENLEGEVETQAAFLRPLQLENHRGDIFALMVFHGREVLTNYFRISPGVIIPPGDYSFNRAGGELVFAQERMFAPLLAAFFGEFYDGTRVNYRAGFAWRPNRHIYAGLNYDYNKIELPAGNFQTRLIQISANWAINAEWSWTNQVQYDNFSNTIGVNSRLRWNRAAGEDVYLVLNHNYDAEGTFRGLTSTKSEILLKYTKTFRY